MPVDERAPSFAEAWRSVLALTLDLGDEVSPRGMPIRERLVVSTEFDANRALLVDSHRGLNYRFAVAEWVWMAAGCDLVEPLARYNSKMRCFSDDGRVLAGAYGPRLRPQWPRVIDVLRRDPDSRQALAVIWRPDDASLRWFIVPDGVRIPGGGSEAQQRVSRDVPCTVAAQFMIRRGRLFSSWTMRSSDLWLGLPYDAFTFSRLAACIAGELRVPLGDLVITAGSSHLYQDQWEKAAEVLDFDLEPQPTLPAHPGFPPSRLRDQVILGRAFEYDDGLEPWETYSRMLAAKTSAAALEVLR